MLVHSEAPQAGGPVEWGLASCWQGSHASFRRCCRTVYVDSLGVPDCFSPAGPVSGEFVGCCLRRDGRYLNHARMRLYPSLRGCQTPAWDVFLAAFYLDGGGREVEQS